MTARRARAASAARFLLLLVGIWPPAYAQSHARDYDSADPWTGVRPESRGTDSAAVAGFVRALGVSDPVVCQFAVMAISSR